MSDTQVNDESPNNIVRIRGLPWQATKDDIVKFFSGCKIKGGSDGVKMTLSHQGRPSGEAYIEFEDADSYSQALDCHRKHMGSRYIEVFASDRQRMQMMIERGGLETATEGPDKQASFVRIRGLPFGSRSDDVIKFFSGMEIMRDGIVFALDNSGRQTGEAYIKFSSVSAADKALSKHREKIGHRYIEVFKSSPQEFRNVKMFTQEQALSENDRRFTPPMYSQDQFMPKMGSNRWVAGPVNRLGPYDRFSRPPTNQRYMGQPTAQVASHSMPLAAISMTPIGASRRADQSWNLDVNLAPTSPNIRPFSVPNDVSSSPTFTTPRHVVHMRGLPYKATENDIKNFFLPLIPCRVSICKDDSGKPSGEADVEFYTHGEAEKAMNKDKANMRHRYIELFLHSAPDSIRNRLGPPVHTSSMSTLAPLPMQRFNPDSSAFTSYSLRSLQLQPSQDTPVYFSSPSTSATNHLIPSFRNVTSNLNNVTFSATPVFQAPDGILRSRI